MLATNTLMITLITYLYLAFNSVRVFSYVPQIISVAKDKSPAKAISLMTWSFWTFANLTTALYATFVVPDYLLSIMSYGNTLGCGIVVAMVICKRKKYSVSDIVSIPAGVISSSTLAYANDDDFKNLLKLKA